MPKSFPIHWGTNLTADRFVDKSISTIFLMSGFQIIVALIFYVSNSSIIHTKRSFEPRYLAQPRFESQIYRQDLT
ncbi:MAG: hypothetical protein KC455_04965 [Carnobacterium sp.]|nr:hypothetical protein [Carnobacterium sp.]